MTKMIILGAGASKACPNIDPDMPMPLLRDLPEVLKRLPQSGFHSLGEYLNRLLAVACGDIELLLTYFYQLNESFFIPRKQYLLDAEWIGQIFRSSALPEVFTDPNEARQVTAILEILQKVAAEQPGSVTFSPANFFTLFQGGLREYFRASVRSYPCPLHLRMFQNLGANDCVVSFNYDDIADHSLFSAGKLTRSSFEGLGFEEVILPPRAVPPDLLGIPDPQLREGIINRFHRVKFLKVHGSFNWWSYVQESEYPKETWTYPVGPAPYTRQSPKGGPVVRYCLGDPGDTANWKNWTSAPIVFPFLAKDSIYRGNAIFGRHLAAFGYELQSAEEIFLVGKNFQNSDHELNGMIRWATYGNVSRVLHIVDTNSHPEFETFHCSLFNASLGRRYTSFEEYV